MKKKLKQFCKDVVICMGNSIDSWKSQIHHWNQEREFESAFQIVYDVWIKEGKIKS